MKYLLFAILSLFAASHAWATETKRFFGTSYNETQMAGGLISLDLTFNDDGTVVGYVDNDPYPGLPAFCGAGYISGTLNGNNLLLNYTSFEPDPGCSFFDGAYVEYYLVISNDRNTISGTFKIFYNGTVGNMYLRSESDCVNIQTYQAIYQVKKGTNEGAYAKQYLCLAEKTCEEFNQSGESGWAGGFVKYMFDWMSTHNQGNTGLDVDCNLLLPAEICFYLTGTHHVDIELRPAFFDYCNVIQSQADIGRWTDDHEAFLANAVDPCFFDLWLSGEACTIPSPLLSSECTAFMLGAWAGTKYIVRQLRDEAQAFCMVNQAGGSIDLLATYMPPPLTQAELSFPNIDSISAYSVSTYSFDLHAGQSYPIQVFSNQNGTFSDLTKATTGTQYFLNIPEDIATISEDGLLTVHSAGMPLVSSRLPLHVYALNGGKVGIGQFAISDVDSDGDLIVDSYETKIGLNPSFKNDFSSDFDNDGLHDFFEAMQRTDPLKDDTDGDGFVDPYELGVRTDPLDPDSTPIAILVENEDTEGPIRISSVYPNPFQDFIVINFDVFENTENVTVSILDLTGKPLVSKNHAALVRGYYSDEFSTPFSKGMYLVVIRTDQGEILQQRVVKQ